MKPEDRYDAIVVGAGPIGLTVANLLGIFGVRTLLVERNQTTVQEPRAVSIDDEALRTMEAMGVVDTVLDGVVPGYGSRYLTADGRCFLTVLPQGRPYGYPRRNAFRQPRLEADLRRALGRFDRVETAFGATLTSVSQTHSAVTAVIEQGGMSRTVTCGYLVAADGGRSEIRKALGIPMEGRTQPERWLIVDLERSPVSDPNTIVFCDSRRPCIALPGPDLTRRFEFKLRPNEPDEEAMQPSFIADLLASHGAHPDSQIVRTVVYTFHALIAGRWSDGRIFLAGDAAHLTPPFAGQGMNSGIRDAHNLAWKLAWVIKGRASPRLLATYEQERRPHVGQMIDLALTMGRVMGPRNRLDAWLVQSAFTLAGVFPRIKRYFGEMRFRPKPRLREGFMLAGPNPMIGNMLPLPEQWGEPTDLEPAARFDSRLGNGFALIGVDVADSVLSSWQLSPMLAPLQCNVFALRREQVPNWPLPAGPVVLLVRPDRYVMAVEEIRDLGKLQTLLSAMRPDGGP